MTERLDVVLFALRGARYQVSIRCGPWKHIPNHEVGKLLLRYICLQALYAKRLRDGGLFLPKPSVRIVRAPHGTR